MRTKGNLGAVVMVLSIAFSLCGCANVDGETPSVSKDNISGQTTSSIVDSTDNSAGISSTGGEYHETISNQSFPTKCKTYKQKAKYFTEEQLVGLFDQTPIKEDKSTGDYSYFEYTTDKYVGRIANNRILNFFPKNGLFYASICDSLASDTEDERYISKDGSLEFASRDKVLENLQVQFKNQFGINPDEWWIKDFYAVKKEGVDFYKKKIAEGAAADADKSAESSDEKIEYLLKQLDNTLSKDFYYINIKFQLDGIPVYMGSSFDYGADLTYSILGASFSVVYSEDGIEELALSYINEVDASAGDSEEVTLIEAEKARDLIQKKFSDIILNTPVEVYDMQLVYLPIAKNNLTSHFETFETKPFYAFYWKETDSYNGETFILDYITYFDAVTGKELGTESVS